MKQLIHPIRLYWGENYAPKPIAIQKIIEDTLYESAHMIHLYPGDIYTQTQEILSKKYNLSPQNIFLHNGIESILPVLFRTYIKKGEDMITFDSTFICYLYNAIAQGAKAITIPVDLYTTIPAEQILRKVTTKTKIICIASPNTTTGLYHLSMSAIEKIVKSFKGIVVVDECYFGIGKKTVLPLIKKYSNLVVLRGVSKNWGLAGLRIAFACANPTIIKKLESHSLDIAEDPIALPSYLVLQKVLPHSNQLEKTFIKHKDAFMKKVSSIDGVTCYPSFSTFMPMVIKGKTSEKELLKIINTLKTEYKILLKDTSKLGYLLIGIPPYHTWDYVLKSLKKLLLPQL